MAILSKPCKQINLKCTTLKLSFTNVRGLHSNSVDCKFFLESNSPDILALCETTLDDSIDSGNFSKKRYLPLIRKDSTTLMHGLVDSLLHGTQPQKTPHILTYVSDWIYSASVFFCLYQSPSMSLCTVFYFNSSNIDEVFSISTSAYVLVFGVFNVRDQDWLTCSGGTDKPGELCYNFRWLNSILGSLTVILAVLLFWIYLFLLTLVFVLPWLSLHWKILITQLSQFPLTFHQIHNRFPVSSHIL